MKPLRLTLALGLLVFVLAGGWYLLRPPAIPVKIQITEGAAILYYNSPASTRSDTRRLRVSERAC